MINTGRAVAIVAPELGIVAQALGSSVKSDAHWHNPVIRRWTQQDTLDNPLDPANANRYAFAGNDPINYTDPTGRAVSQCLPSVGGTAFSAVGVGASIKTLAVATTIAAPGFGLAVVGVIAGGAILAYGAAAIINECG